MKLKAVLFDMDGTITRPLLDFPRIKRDMGLSAEALILESLAAMTSAARARAMEVLEHHERLAAEASQLNDGAEELLLWLAERGLKTGIITRNSRVSVETVFARHALRFDVIISREDAVPKPDPDGLHLALASLRVSADEAVYVGDHAIDVVAGRAAGVKTIWLVHGVSHGPGVDAGGVETHGGVKADWVVGDLGEVLGILDGL